MKTFVNLLLFCLLTIGVRAHASACNNSELNQVKSKVYEAEPGKNENCALAVDAVINDANTVIAIEDDQEEESENENKKQECPGGYETPILFFNFSLTLHQFSTCSKEIFYLNLPIYITQRILRI
jgi:hypothetical protein